ncbi:hypothetical protein [Naumannella cuiyingiana]|uniref:Uncharacterized protein n=1 Tax=Naumannella cuiyingiana TaxID=1347891 RepID=A0A7Z0IK94_9ACTN|nr:hypothetical protein [Naumannella cuiyingiana]NYI70296.1 hypothetical protein [Naumannella cuiyingiana]
MSGVPGRAPRIVIAIASLAAAAGIGLGTIGSLGVDSAKGGFQWSVQPTQTTTNAGPAAGGFQW